MFRSVNDDFFERVQKDRAARTQSNKDRLMSLLVDRVTRGNDDGRGCDTGWGCDSSGSWGPDSDSTAFSSDSDESHVWRHERRDHEREEEEAKEKEEVDQEEMFR